MPSQDQCRAARGLLGWTQQNLADQAGLSKTAINNFERGTHELRNDSHQSIRDAFERGGVEFIGDYGVQRRREAVKILKGPDALPRLWDDIFETVKESGGEVMIANLDETRSRAASPQRFEEHLKRLSENNITERLLVCEGDTTFVQPKECYRWLARNVFEAGMTSFIYADKIALQLWQDAMIILIQSQAAHNAERHRFELLWKTAGTF